MLKNLFKFLLVLLCICSCKSTNQEKSTSTLPESFLTFYHEFHTDSLYQMDHIIFPLDGKPAMMDTIVHAYHWKKSEWTMHKNFIHKNGEFEQSFDLIDPTIVEEYIIHKTTGFGLFRRYSIISGEWYLIYYIGNNPPEKMRF